MNEKGEVDVKLVRVNYIEKGNGSEWEFQSK